MKSAGLCHSHLDVLKHYSCNCPTFAMVKPTCDLWHTLENMYANKTISCTMDIFEFMFPYVRVSEGGTLGCGCRGHQDEVWLPLPCSSAGAVRQRWRRLARGGASEAGAVPASQGVARVLGLTGSS